MGGCYFRRLCVYVVRAYRTLQLSVGSESQYGLAAGANRLEGPRRVDFVRGGRGAKRRREEQVVADEEDGKRDFTVRIYQYLVYLVYNIQAT